MSIYPSTRVLPYVYKLVHKETGQFYYGYRSSNTVPSSDDLGIKYFTSSKSIAKIGFENFTVSIIAEFFDKVGAQEFELSLITESWDDPLRLNKMLPGKAFFRFNHHTEESKKRMSEASKLRTGWKHTEDTKARIGDALRGVTRKPFTQETKDRISKSSRGIPKSAEHCSNLSAAAKGSTKMPQSAEHKAKISEAVKLAWAKRKSLI